MGTTLGLTPIQTEKNNEKTLSITGFFITCICTTKMIQFETTRLKIETTGKILKPPNIKSETAFKLVKQSSKKPQISL